MAVVSVSATEMLDQHPKACLVAERAVNAQWTRRGPRSSRVYTNILTNIHNVLITKYLGPTTATVEIQQIPR
jgi:hypothetical protein